MSGINSDFSDGFSSAIRYGQLSLKMKTSSKLDLEEFVLQWKLNVTNADLKSETLTSPIFIGGVRSQHSWQLKFTNWSVYVNLLKIGNKEFSENGKEVRAKAFISLEKLENLEVQQGLKNSELSGIKPGTIDLPSPLNKIFSPFFLNSRKSYIDNENEVLTVYCTISIKCGIKHSEIEQTLLPCFQITQNEVAAGSTHHSAKTLKALHNSGDFSDIVISTERERIPAHRAILAAQSPVFKAMFQTRMLETRRNVFEIKEFGPDVVRAMLEFIYTGEASNLTDPGEVADLFRISDKYGLLELKDACEQKLCFKLNEENAAEFFHLATLCNAKTLKVFALRFIHENKLKVGDTEFFKKLVETDPNSLLELYLSI